MHKYHNNRPDYDTPEYKRWRKIVFYRDKFSCVLCASKDKIQAHHIVKYSVCPELRYVISNGVTLCENCHLKVTGSEEAYELRFKQIVSKNKVESKIRGNKYSSVKKGKYRMHNPNIRYGY